MVGIKQTVIIKNKSYDLLNNDGTTSYMYGKQRDIYRLDFPYTRDEVLAMGWEDGVNWSQTYDNTYIDPETQQEVTEHHEWDRSDHDLVLDIIEHKDGTCSIYMGAKTNEELLQETVNDLLGV